MTIQLQRCWKIQTVSKTMKFRFDPCNTWLFLARCYTTARQAFQCWFHIFHIPSLIVHNTSIAIYTCTHTPLKSLLHFYEFFSREWRLSRLLSKIKGKRYPCVFFCKQSFRFFARAKLKILAGIRGASLVVSTAWFFVHGPRRQAGKQAGTHSLSQLQLRTAPDVLAMTVSFNDFLRHARSLARATRLARQKREFYPRIRD